MKEIKKDIYWIGKVDDRKVPFHRLVLEKGTSYNSYLIRDEKNVVIDTVDILFGKEFTDNLAKEIDLEAIDYVVINHTEPDHSGALGAFIRKAKNARILCTDLAVPELMEMYKIGIERFQTVKDNEVVNIGSRNLRFLHVPYLHTEETMVTYLEEDRMLFTCDIFSTHIADTKLTLSELEDSSSIDEDFKVYYSLIMDPHRRYILPMIEKIRDLEIETIATSHGYVIDKDVQKYIGIYEENATRAKSNVKALILYNSMSGNTKKMSFILEEELKKLDIETEVVNTQTKDKEEILTKIQYADGILFGSSTRYADISGNLEEILRELKDLEVEGKVAGAFGSYGWSGEAVEVVQDYLISAGMKTLKTTDAIRGTGMSDVAFPLRVRFNPADSLDAIKASAAYFADSIRF